MTQEEDTSCSEQPTTLRTDINTFTSFMTADSPVHSANALSLLESLARGEPQSELSLPSSTSRQVGKISQYISSYDIKTKYKTDSYTWPIPDESSLLVHIRLMNYPKVKEILQNENMKNSDIYAARVREYQLAISEKDQVLAVYLTQLLARAQIQTNLEVNPDVKYEELKPRYARF